MTAEHQRIVLPIIPVFNPEAGLKGLCQDLVNLFGEVLVVDDGSVENVRAFDSLPKGVTVIHHTVNKGKGRAIKTGIEWVLANRVEIKIIVFADGDGQHRPCDIAAVATCAVKTNRVTIGVRDFSKAGIPFRSRFGNVLTSFLVRLFYHLRIYDTQTGLRAIPSDLFSMMLEISGERYEYEMRLFGELYNRRLTHEQVSIDTIYIESNRASHFRPIVDSYLIYRGLFGQTIDQVARFTLSSVAGFVTDNLVFTVALYGFHIVGYHRCYSILLSLFVARAISAFLNYLFNREYVFSSTVTVSVSLLRYWLLVLLIAGLSYAGTLMISTCLDAKGVAVTAVKISVETVLFALSYKLQKVWVFK